MLLAWTDMKTKRVYLNGKEIGSAGTWHEAAALVTKFLQRTVSAREALDRGSEGPDGFHIEIRS